MAGEDIQVLESQAEASAPSAPTKRKVVPNACEYCRRSKMRCVRDSEGAPCERCKRAKKVCEARLKLPTTKTSTSDTTSPTNVVDLLNTSPYQMISGSEPLPFPFPSVSHMPLPIAVNTAPATQYRTVSEPNIDQQWLPSAPLDLLATLGTSTVATQDVQTQELIQHRETILRVSKASVNGRIPPVPPQAYFSADREISQQFDYSDVCDPILQNVLSEEDAKILFAFFAEHLQSMVNPACDDGSQAAPDDIAQILILDSRLHTYDRVRSKSNLLFTVILASAAKFLPGHASTASRLEQHVRDLLGKVFLSGATSLSICQAISAYCPWLDAGLHSSLDQTNSYLTLANQKIIALRRSLPLTVNWDVVEERSFERLCLVLYSFERGTALVSGKPREFMLKDLPIQTSISAWAHHPMASPTDRTLGALIAMRQDVPGVLQTLSTTQPGTAGSSTRFKPSPDIVQAVLSAYHSSWRTNWLDTLLPAQRAYLTIVGEHTILSILVVVLKEHIGEGTEKDLMQQTLVASLQVCQAFMIADKECIRYMGNNTWLIVCYAGCLGLKLLAGRRESGTPVDLSVYSLLTQMADRMEDLGNEPTHRYGRSRLYGMRLRTMLQNHIETRMPASRAQSPPGQLNAVSSAANPSIDNQQPLLNTSPQNYQLYSGNGSYIEPPQVQPDLGIFDTSGIDVMNMSKDEISALLCSDTWLTMANDGSPTAFLDFWEFGNV